MKWDSNIDSDLIGPIVGVCFTLIVLAARFGMTGEAVLLLTLFAVIIVVVVSTLILSAIRSIKNKLFNKKIKTKFQYSHTKQYLDSEGKWHPLKEFIPETKDVPTPHLIKKTIKIKSNGLAEQVVTISFPVGSPEEAFVVEEPIVETPKTPKTPKKPKKSNEPVKEPPKSTAESEPPINADKETKLAAIVEKEIDHNTEIDKAAKHSFSVMQDVLKETNVIP